MNIAILGGGGRMGQGIAKDLISEHSSYVSSVLICEAQFEHAERTVVAINDTRLKAVAMDASIKSNLVAFLKGIDICINSVPTFVGLQLDIFQAAFEAGCTYVDLGGMGVYTLKQKAEHQKWADAGLTAVIGLGADPGMSNVICRAVANELDEIDKINLYWAATIEGTENPILVPPYSVSTVLAEYANSSMQFLEGGLVEVGAQMGKETLMLPEPWGETEFMYSQHSEPLTVPFADGIQKKGIQEFTWKLHLPERENEAWVGLVKAGFGDFDKPVTVGDSEIAPIDFLNAMIDRNIQENQHKIPDQLIHEIHIAIGEGRRAGEPARVSCVVTASPDDPIYEGYVDAATSMNGSFGAQLVLQNQKKPGVWAPEEYFDTKQYFSELKKRHFLVSLQEGSQAICRGKTN